MFTPGAAAASASFFSVSAITPTAMAFVVQSNLTLLRSPLGGKFLSSTELTPTTRFRKDLQKFKHQRKIVQDLQKALESLVHQKPLHKKYLDHPLGGNWKGSRECHIHPDVLLIFRIDIEKRNLFLERLGSHSELF